jgi:drug/metabolite transporter (DMT)-like permease
VFVKEVLEVVHPVALVAWRFLLAGGMMAVYLVVRRNSLFAQWRRGLFLGLMLYVLYVTQNIGLTITTASNSGFITGLFVAFVPLFLWYPFRRTPTRFEILASGVALLGMGILTGGLRDINSGDVLTLTCAVIYALHILYTDKYVRNGGEPWTLVCQQFLVTGALGLLTAFVIDAPLALPTPRAVWIVLALTIFPSLTAYVIQIHAQKIAPPLRVTLIFAMEPVFAGVLAWTYGAEPFIIHRAIGGLLIAAALVISGIPPKRGVRQSGPG